MLDTRLSILVFANIPGKGFVGTCYYPGFLGRGETSEASGRVLPQECNQAHRLFRKRFLGDLRLFVCAQTHCLPNLDLLGVEQCEFGQQLFQSGPGLQM